MKRISLIIPTYNEAKNIPLLLEELFSVVDTNRFDLEVIIVDDNSPDGTSEVARSLADSYPVQVLTREGKLGLGSAVRAGFDHSDREYVAVMDADLSHDPVILNNMFEQLGHGKITMGTRFGAESEVEEWAWWRKLLSTVGVGLAKLTSRVKDPLSGYFALHRSVIDGVELSTTGYKILFEILVKGNHVEVHEFPYTFRARIHSSSKLNTKEYILFLQQTGAYTWYKVRSITKKKAQNALVSIGSHSETRTHLFWIILVSGCLAFFRIGHQSLWTDEAISTVWAASKSLQWIWEVVPQFDLHPPLYYTVLHIWQNIFGDGVIAIRGLSAIFHIASAVLIYIVSLNLFKKNIISLFIALIFATNPFAVQYAQEVRSYSMLFFGVLLQSYVFYTIMVKHVAPRMLFLYVLLSVCLLYLNVLSLIVLFVQGCIALYKKRKSFTPFAIVYGAIGLLYLPVLHTLSRLEAYDFSYFHSENLSIFIKGIVVVAGFIGGRVNILNGKWGIYMPLLALSLLIYGIFLLFIIAKRKRIKSALFWYAGALFASLLFAAHLRLPVPDPKYFFAVFPFFILLLGNLLAVSKKKQAMVMAGAMILLNTVFLYTYYFDDRYEKEDWKSIVVAIESNSKQEVSKEAIVLSPVSDQHATWEYYADPMLLPAIGVNQGDTSFEGINAVFENEGIAQYDIIYLSRFIYALYDPEDNIRKNIESLGYVHTDTFVDTKVEFWRYDKQQ